MKRLIFVLLAVLLPTSVPALEARSFTRTGALPHAPTLGASLAPYLNNQSAHIQGVPGGVVIEVGSWVGINLTAVQAEVTNAPADSAPVRAKAAMDTTQGITACFTEAMVRALVPTLNQTRIDPLAIKTSITADQVRTAIKTQIDTLQCGQ